MEPPPSGSLQKSLSGVGGKRGPEKGAGLKKGQVRVEKGSGRAGVAGNFRKFPQFPAIAEISGNFRKFPVISQQFRKFPPILPRNAVRGNFWQFPEIAGNFWQNFRKFPEIAGPPPPPGRQQLPAISGKLPAISGNFRKLRKQCPLTPDSAKIPLQGKNNPRNIDFMLVLKGLFGGP